MMNLAININALMPEIIIATSAMLVLLLGLFFKDKNNHLIYGVSQITLLLAAMLVAHSGFGPTYRVFNDMHIIDPAGNFLKLLSFIATSFVFLYSRSYLRKKQLLNGEYFSLTLFALLGIMLMISGANLLMIYLGLELLSLSLYALIALNRDNLDATEAAMKYFVLGALASGLMLYGMSMIYGLTGSLDLQVIATHLAEMNLDPSIMAFGLVFIVVGIAFKFGAVPFQMWVPDIYHGAALPMTMMISSMPKFASVALAARLLFQGLEPLAVDWQQMLLIMAILSMILGNITAIAQDNIKRMLAYSTISHVGFMFFGMMSGTINGLSSTFFYVACYALMTLAAFGAIITLSQKNKDFDQLNDYKGLSQRNPMMALMIMIIMLSLAGIPPTIGFYAKFSVLQSAIEVGMVWPAVIAVLMALIGMFYYLRIIKLMYFDSPSSSQKIHFSGDLLFILGINSFSLILLGLSPKLLMSLAALAVGLSF